MYLKGINSLRFFAALLVVIFHCNDGLRQLRPDLFYNHPILMKGPFAVDLFFIISGFLLTYLALGEIKRSGVLNLRRFFYRRILRIFPLYYLGVFLGFFTMGIIYPLLIGVTYFDFAITEVIWYYLGFLPNYVIVHWQNIGPMYSLWSIGVEEQFYLFFPFLVLFMTSRQKEILISFLCFLGYYFFFLAVEYNFIELMAWVKQLIVLTLRFHFLFLGMFFGSVFFYNRDNKFFQFIEMMPVQLLIYLAFLYLLLFVSPNHPVHHILGGCLFLFILINGAREVSLVNLEKQQLSYLGVISYGIYIFHPYVSLIIRYCMEKLRFLNDLISFSPILFHIIVALISILVAGISYKYYESFFLKLKKRYK